MTGFTEDAKPSDYEECAADQGVGPDPMNVLIMAVQEAEMQFRRTASMGGLRQPDLAKYADLQIAIKAAVVAAGGKWS